MSTSSSRNYKEKYLRALEDHERQERQFDLQLDYMRKTIVHLSAAAQGLDKALDAEMLSLKEKFRGAKGAQVVEQMDRVRKAVNDFEQNRDSENAAAAKAMTALLDQYQELKMPAETKQKLQKFSGGIKKSLSSYRIYPALLAEVAKLQKMAFEAAAEPSKGFWDRLKPGRQMSYEQAEDASPKARSKAAPREALEPIDAENEQELQLDVSEDTPSEYQPGNFKALTEDEDTYPQVAERISATLQGLIDKIQPNDIIKHKVEIVQARLERGMDWFALAVTLEDVRDILLLRYLDVDREFSDYLKQVNDELLNISKVLGLALDRETANSEAVGKFSNRVCDEVERLQHSMESSDSLDGLKQGVRDHIEHIQDALKQYRAEEKPKQEEGSLTEQLKALVERVHSIESESQKTKELLEEERHKATHDTLTSLPNREAYNERAFHELQRFKRYKRPLTMAVCDVDHFKRINDTYGHQAGDKVLRLLARILATRLRKVDFVARYGGEEFVMLLPETTAEQAFTVLDKIRMVIGKSAFRFKDDPVTITISMGITGLEAEDSVESAFERADEALYKAKNDGRNRCIVLPGVAENSEEDQA